MTATRSLIRCLRLAWCLALVVGVGNFAQAQTDDDGVDARTNSSALARQLGEKDPLVRQRAAEALARLAAVDQKKLIEGYRLQEKDKKVTLALDWALYRIGKTEALFGIVRALDSGRHDQAVGYLAQLETPTLLYPLLKQEDSPPRMTTGLLEALGRIGDAESIDKIKPFRDSFSPGVAEAAEVATEQIENRLGQIPAPKPSRPRTVRKAEETSP